MWMYPPGAANAFTPSVSSTMNLNGRFGRVLFFTSRVPASVT